MESTKTFMDDPDFERKWKAIQEDFVIPPRPIEAPQLDLTLPLLEPNPVTRPSDSLLTKTQHFMLYQFQQLGRQALARAIYKIAGQYASMTGAASMFMRSD